MSDKKIAVFGILSDKIDLDRAVDSLKMIGFSNRDISVLLPDDNSELGHEKNTKAPEGATTGATTGVVLGGALGWLIGAGMLAIPGVGPFIAAGPIMAALAGAGVGGAVLGVSGGLIGLGMPEFEAKRYESQIKNGRILLSVHCGTSDEVNRAKESLKRCNAQDIASTGESKPTEEKSTSTKNVSGMNRPDSTDASPRTY
ncbi:MAG: DUF3341 domain-containing protein [Proteobacteria bacterium]|nr:DUF3341 domain-containing protein [Pseudomonadota bacterium]